MKLSKLYTDNPRIFQSIEFNDGLNVVVAEIRLPKNHDIDTHNLGKTTVGSVIDFCFLSGTSKNHYLISKIDIIGELVFYLELDFGDSTYLTIRRSNAKPTRVCFKKHKGKCENFSSLEESGWDHFDIPLEKARLILDGQLDWRFLKPYNYRKIMGYLLRTQDDYREVFKLRKFASKHMDWKPFLAHILGFNAKYIASHYEAEKILDEKKEIEKTIKLELGGSVEDISKIEGLVLLKRKDEKKKETQLNDFDFRVPDKENIKTLVDKLEREISINNKESYRLNHNKKRIEKSLKDGEILFDPNDAQLLFKEAGVLFKGQVKKDYEQLIEFNKAITEERKDYLQEELDEIKNEIKIVNSNLNKGGKKRSELLSFLSETDSVEKYKNISNDLVDLRTDIESLTRKREHLNKLQEMRADIRELESEKSKLRVCIEKDVEDKSSDEDSLFSKIRILYSEFIEQVIDQKALLSAPPNSKGHLEFKAELLDISGNSTYADRGHTYKKLLCIAFDLSILLAHAENKFPKFVFHDGVFESLDDRKKRNLIDSLRDYAAQDMQVIITMIDSDMPSVDKDEDPPIREDEIILRLHDEGKAGRLFKTTSW